jgi:hypothetical protein
MLDVIIFTHLQRQYSVTEDKNKKVAGDFATFLIFIEHMNKTPTANKQPSQIPSTP